MLRALLLSLAVSVVTPAVGLAQSWSYTGGDGKTVTLDHVPSRIIADSGAAAALIAFGIRPVGIYGNNPPEQEKQLEGVDASGIAIIGQSWGEIDVEKMTSAERDQTKQRLGELLKTETVVVEPNDAITAEQRDFADSIREGRRPLVSGADGLDALRIALRIIEALELQAEREAGHPHKIPMGPAGPHFPPSRLPQRRAG